MSERSELAKRVGVFLLENDLCQVYGGDAILMCGGRYRSIGFSQRCNLDGEVRVYGPKFILITWQTRYQNVPAEGREAFKTEEAALAFLKAAFKDHTEWEEMTAERKS